MNHLETDEERRERWHSSLCTRFVQAVRATDWSDIILTPHSELEYQSVCSLPFEWIDNNNNNNNKNEESHNHHLKLKLALERHGFLVVSGVLGPEECQEVLELGWDWIEAASVAEQKIREEPNGSETTLEVARKPPVCRTEVSTLSSEFFPRSLEGGILPFYGSGHSSCAWMVRSHPNVKQVFAALYDTNKLISSLDGLVFWRSHESAPGDSGWFHVDQNPRHKPAQECVQGLVNLLPVTPSTGGNALSVQSHHDFGHILDPDGPCYDFYQTRLDEIAGDDWLEIDPNDSSILHPRRILSVLLKPGDLLLWDSRVAHCSYPPTNKSNTHAGLVRAATLVSMMPTSRATRRVLMDRQQAVEHHRTLTHWANQVVPLGAECVEEVRLEQQRVQWIQHWQNQVGRKVLYEWNDLSDEQQRLVVGEEM